MSRLRALAARRAQTDDGAPVQVFSSASAMRQAPWQDPATGSRPVTKWLESNQVARAPRPQPSRAVFR